MRDKNGKLIEIDSEVDVPAPSQSDCHNHPFTGRVIALDDGNNLITVVDQDDDAYDIEADRVEVV